MAQPGARCSATTTSRTRPPRSTLAPLDLRPVPADDWSLDGSTSGTGRARLAVAARHRPSAASDGGYDLAQHYARVRAARTEEMLAGIEPLVETGFTDDADVVVVAFGTPAKYVRAAVTPASAAEGARIGFVRPITLLPFPSDAIARAAAGARTVGVYENNQGQMVDDVRLAVAGAAPVQFIGRLSLDGSGFGIAPDLDGDYLRDRTRGARWHERSDVLPPTRRPRSAPAWSTTSRRRCSTSASTTSAPAAASRSRCAPSSRRSRQLGAVQRAIGVIGIGCYTAFSNTLDIDLVQALHGRAPSVATGVKRCRPTRSCSRCRATATW